MSKHGEEMDYFARLAILFFGIPAFVGALVGGVYLIKWLLDHGGGWRLLGFALIWLLVAAFWAGDDGDGPGVVGW